MSVCIYVCRIWREYFPGLLIGTPRFGGLASPIHANMTDVTPCFPALWFPCICVKKGSGGCGGVSGITVWGVKKRSIRCLYNCSELKFSGNLSVEKERIFPSLSKCSVTACDVLSKCSVTACDVLSKSLVELVDLLFIEKIKLDKSCFLVNIFCHVIFNT